MAWNPYTDQQNRGYAHILTTLFPEQTKTLPRIIIWSFIFLIDLTAGIVLATHFGLYQFSHYRNQAAMLLGASLPILGIIGIFWLQGVLWGALTKLFRQLFRKETP